MITQLDVTQTAILQALRETKSRIAGLIEVADHLQSQLVAAIGDADEAVDAHGCRAFTWKAPRRFDADSATALLTDEQLGRCQKIDPAKVRRHLTAEQLETVMIAGASRRFVLAEQK